MNKQKYIKWYKLAQAAVNDEKLVPTLSDAEIMELVSQEDWLMFVLRRFVSTNEAKNAPVPNVFMNIYGDDKKNYGRIGVVFNNVKAVGVLRNILNKHCKSEKGVLTELLLSLDGSWEITVKRKIKEHHHLQPPNYVTEFQVCSNKINDKIVDELIFWANKIREEGNENRLSKETFYRETPSVCLMEIAFELNEDEFRKRIKEAFNVLKVCLEIKSDGTIKSIVKSQKKELDALEAELEGKLRKKNFFEKTGLHRDQWENLLSEIIEIQTKIQVLGEEI